MLNNTKQFYAMLSIAIQAMTRNDDGNWGKSKVWKKLKDYFKIKSWMNFDNSRSFFVPLVVSAIGAIIKL